MSFENEPLRLNPHRLEVDPVGHWRVSLPDGTTYVVPAAFHGFFRLVHSGASFSALTLSLREAGARFALLAKFLVFLNERGLLADSRFVQLAEAFRADYVWRGSIAFDEIFSLELFRLRERPGSATARAILLGVIFVIAASALLEFIAVTSGMRTGWTEAGTRASIGLSLLVAFVFAFAAGRSLRAIAQFCLLRAAGFGARLRVKLDWAFLSIVTDDASSAPSDAAYVAASFFALGWLVLPGAFSWHLPYGADAFVGVFSMLVCLAELSPFRQSALTETLRSLYVYMDREREDGSNIEERIRVLHTVVTTFWCAGLAAFLFWPTRWLVHDLWANSSASELTGESRVALAIVGLGLLVVLLSFVDDMASGAGFGGDARSIRKLWRRRKSGLQVNEAVRAGKIPSREELEGLPLLRQMDTQSKTALLKNAEIIDVEPGERICSQGDEDRTLFIVLSGRLSVGKRASSGRRRTLALLAPGAVFGEVAFFLGEKRSADVHAVEPSRLLAIRHDERISTLDRTKSEELQLRIRFLQALVGSPFFRELPADALDALVFSGQKKIFRPGEKIFSEGEAGDACYFIIQGEASVVQNFKPINRMKNGDAFGEIALLKPSLLRTATIAAVSELITVRVDGGRLWSLLTSHLPLAMELESLAEARLRKDQRRAEEINK